VYNVYIILIHSFINTHKAANNKYKTYRKTKNIHNTKNAILKYNYAVTVSAK